MTLEEQQRAREWATRQLGDIQALKRTDAFDRYWMARLRQKREETERLFKYSPHDENCSHEQREIYRQILLFIEELLQLPEKDETAAKRTIEMLG